MTDTVVATAVVPVEIEDPATALAEWLSCYGAADANAAWLLCDRHPGENRALTVVGADLSARSLTFAELRERSQRVAGGLAELGVRPGDRVATLMGKSAELVVSLLAIWRLGAVHVPLFTAFGPPAIDMRLRDGDVRVVICDRQQRPKLTSAEGTSEDAGRYIVNTADRPEAGDVSFAHLLESQPVPGRAMGGDAPLIHIYTSGTTGCPKGVVVPIRAVAGFHAYQIYGLDMRDSDVFWNAADPGWGYGLYFGICGPLGAGHGILLVQGSFSPEVTLQVLDRFGVTNFAAAPTVYRALRAAPLSIPPGLRLRRCSSAGEPLNPDVVDWAKDALGVAVHDHYGQTELGMVLGNHHHPAVARPLVPGSMGQPLPGWSVAVLCADRDEPAAAGASGRLAVHVAESSLLWFSGYHRDPDKTAERFTADGHWYLTGDVASTDGEGNYFFSARDDDVIIMAGYRIGPFEVESILVEHPAVAEAAAVGLPDTLRGEVLEAFVVLRPGHRASADLEADLQVRVKQRLSAHAYPRRVHVVEELPKTSSGKIQRFLLRQKYGALR